jgi:hypothetical protein
MSKSDKHFRESNWFAACMAIGAFIVYFVEELVGFDKMNPGATPKTFTEVVSEWPRLLGLSVLFFAGAWWWKMSQKEKETFICNSCGETIEKDKEDTAEVPLLTCRKCGGNLEGLEGYFDRHPDKRL